MGLRDRYAERQAEATRVSRMSRELIKSGPSRTKLVAVVLDVNGNPRFDESFPEELKASVLAKLKEGVE